MIYPDEDGCHGPCRQGRLPCPHPEICFDPERENSPLWTATLFVGVIMVVAVLFIAWLVAKR